MHCLTNAYVTALKPLLLGILVLVRSILNTAWDKYFDTKLENFSQIPIGFKNTSFLCTDGKKDLFLRCTLKISYQTK